jgi:hypothetical protein
VLTKSAAGDYAAQRWPEHAELLRRAVRDRAGERQEFTVRDGRQALELLRACVAVAEG